MVFNFAGEYLDGKQLTEKEKLKIFSDMIARQDKIDARKKESIDKREICVTESELEAQEQRMVDSGKTWEDIKNECI
jgi:hypothetical protein